MKISRLACLLLSVLALSCAGSGGPVVVDAQWNLSCPSGGAADCGSLAQQTCLGDVGLRTIVGQHGETACTGDQIIAICEAVDRSDGTTDITLEANVDRNGGVTPRFALELSAKVDRSDDSVERCNVTIIEDEVPYDIGACGEGPPTMEQPCQLSNVSTGSEIVFDLECDALLSSLTELAFDVGALGGGPTTMRFANCTGF